MPDIRKTAELVQEISAASKEQTVGDVRRILKTYNIVNEADKGVGDE